MVMSCVPQAVCRGCHVCRGLSIGDVMCHRLSIGDVMCVTGCLW